MTSLRLVLRDEDTEALYWLDLAKQVLAGEVTPDAALRALKFGTRSKAADNQANELQP
jgi:hypothetical protein